MELWQHKPVLFGKASGATTLPSSVQLRHLRFLEATRHAAVNVRVGSCGLFDRAAARRTRNSSLKSGQGKHVYKADLGDACVTRPRLAHGAVVCTLLRALFVQLTHQASLWSGFTRGDFVHKLWLRGPLVDSRRPAHDRTGHMPVSALVAMKDRGPV